MLKTFFTQEPTAGPSSSEPEVTLSPLEQFIKEKEGEFLLAIHPKRPLLPYTYIRTEFSFFCSAKERGPW